MEEHSSSEVITVSSPTRSTNRGRFEITEVVTGGPSSPTNSNHCTSSVSQVPSSLKDSSSSNSDSPLEEKENAINPVNSLSISPSSPALSSSSSSSATLSAPSSSSGLTLFQNALSQLLNNSVVEVMEALETLLVYTKNLILYPEEKKYRKIKISNIHYQERLGHLPGALEAMAAIGYLPIGDYLRLDEKRIQDSNNEAMLLQLEHIVNQHLAQVRKGWSELPARLDETHSYSSVAGVGSHSAIGKRNNMEDDEIIVDRFCGVAQQGYFGLYDGHGGRATVDFVVKALHMNLEQHLKRHPNSSLHEAFKSSYLATDGQLRRQNILRSGTTSVTCVVREEEGKRWLFTANVGDSRAVLCRGGKAVRLTVDHKASLPEEAKRITDAGGFIGRNKRVNGVLAISRALGDHMLKENDVVSAEPHVTDTLLTPEDTHILLACDGVWDVMSDQEAIDFMWTNLNHYQELLHKFEQVQINKENGVENLKGDEQEKEVKETEDMERDGLKEKKEESPGESIVMDTETNGESASSEFKINMDIESSGGKDAADPQSSEFLYDAAEDKARKTKDKQTSSNSANSQEYPKNINEVLSLTAKSLVRKALDLRSLDNVTVMIIQL